ncbi:MAG: hypothetical protein LQ344_000876 [Seirophora lacunosa]|nr:MAG: hypothetical protein LQ344_000876 [Seirophora lacunosa]
MAPSNPLLGSSSLPGCPKHWKRAQDDALKAAYPAMRTSSMITAFKRTTCRLVLATLSPRDLLPNLRDPYPNAANLISYDLDFLSRRIKHLLGPAAHSNREGFLANWAKTPRSQTTRACSHGCEASGRRNSRVWQDLSSQDHRCGGCGRTDLTILPPNPALTRVRDLVTAGASITRPKQHHHHLNTPFPGIYSPATTPEPLRRAPAHSIITGPASWTRAHMRHLKESYITQKFYHPNFSISDFKMALAIFFPADAPDPDVAALHVAPATFDLCFVHNMLERLFGACTCRQFDIANPSAPAGAPRRKCYLRPWVRVEGADEERLVGCGKCELGGEAVYAVPVKGGGEGDVRYKWFRCGGCGDSDVKSAEVLK